MPVCRPPMKYAHNEGHTDICYSDDGKFILTSGSEGDLRIWTSPTDDNQFDKCVGDTVFAIAQKGDKIYVGTDDNSVQIFTYPGAELDGLLTRFTAPVTDISVSSDGKFIAASSRDMKIHVYNTTTESDVVISGHEAPVLSVAMDPRHEFVVSSSCDGTVRVWNVANQSQVKKWDNVLQPSKSFTLTRSLCRMSWQPIKGYYLAVPFGEEIHIFDRKVWDKKFVISSPITVPQIFSICAWSPDEQFLAAGATGGDILFWSLKKGKVTEVSRQKKTGAPICGLTWNPDVEKKELAYSNKDGHFGIIENCCSEEILSSNFEFEEEGHNFKNTDAKKNLALDKNSLEDMFSEPLEFDADDDDDDDDDNNISLDKIKSQYPLEDDMLSVKDDAPVIERSESRMSIMSGIDKPIMPTALLQAPFQPSSTPLSLTHRFMLWNDVGIVYHYNTDEENAIQVEFHDAELHHNLRIDNTLSHHIAALSEKALVLACESQGEKIPSKLVCVFLKAWDGSKEWSVDLPTEEEAVCVAVGDNWVAVATDVRIVRIYSLSGCQKQIISSSGAIVCMAGFRNKLMVVCQGATSIPGDYALNYTLYDTNRLYSRALSQPLPLGPTAELRWLGFTDEGSACMTDSSGMLNILVNNSVWQPICNVKPKTKLDHYFVVGVCEKLRNIRGLMCKGAVYPRTTPKPILSEISWKIPLCDIDGEKGQLEDKLWQLIMVKKNLEALEDFSNSYIETKQTISKDILTTGVKLFALACKSGLDMRALEICEMIDDPKFISIAIKYAEKMEKISLINQLSKIDFKQSRKERSPSPVFSRQNQFMSSRPRNSLREPTSVNALNDFSQDVFGEENDENREENLILAHKKRKAVESLSSNLSPVPRGFNPFKKKNMNGDNEGLEALDTITKKEPPAKKDSFNFDKKLSARKMKKDSEAEKPNKKPSFLEWFEGEKPNLQEEFPELDLQELTKTAMKRYKSLKASSQISAPSQNSTKEVRNLKSFFQTSGPLDDSQKSTTSELPNSDTTEMPITDSQMSETQMSETQMSETQMPET